MRDAAQEGAGGRGTAASARAPWFAGLRGPDAFWRVWRSRRRLERAAQRYFVDTRPIPPEDLEHASQFVREQGWIKPSSRSVTSRAENWELIERWVEHYPDDWRLLFKRDSETLEVRVPEDVWRAFDPIRPGAAVSQASTNK